MNIQLDGAATINKGGELMLYSIIEQIEKRYPDATVYWNAKHGAQSAKYIDTSLNFHKRWLMEKFGNVIKKYRIIGVFKKLKLPYKWMTITYVPKNKKIDVILDASGYAFCDGTAAGMIKDRNDYYKRHKENKTKIIFLPQAFGPFQTKNGKRLSDVLDKFSDLLIARDEISENNLIEVGVSSKKILRYPDFTCLCEGIFPNKYENIKGKVCIIPNIRLFKDTNLTRVEYLSYVSKVIDICLNKNKEVFLLNHEALGDLKLCKEINSLFDNRFTIVSDLTAKEVKGVIANSYAVISGRYHGVANALNSNVPCLANSWNYKYKFLLKEYQQEKMLLEMNVSDNDFKKKLDAILSEEENAKIREQLKITSKILKNKTTEMWENVWNYAENK